MPIKKNSNVAMNVIAFSKALTLPSRMTISKNTLVKKPYLSGKGSTNFTCGNCNFTLMRRVEREQVDNTALQCPICNGYNSL